MAKLIKTTPKFLKSIEDLARKCCRQEDIAIKMGFSKPMFVHNKKIREAWEKGRADLNISVLSNYARNVTSEKPDFKYHKHFLATQCGIIEPKEEKIVIQKDYDLTDEQALKIAEIVKEKGDAS